MGYALPVCSLSDHFQYFFGCLNPSESFIQIASRQYNTIKSLIEDRSGPAGVLSPRCFLQGSYRQQTAIYAINDVDIIVLCKLWQPPSIGAGSGPGWNRNVIFDTIASPLINDGRYTDKVRYSTSSMCIKVELGIKVEILPVVYKQGQTDWQAEPFRLWRPERETWEDGYARMHQAALTLKNDGKRTDGNFIPMIKVLKHLRSLHKLGSVSFHLECLLHAVPDHLFLGTPAAYICDVLEYMASINPEAWYAAGILTPCRERNIFSPTEWKLEEWRTFHRFIQLWAKGARLAVEALTTSEAIKVWRLVLGADYFPSTVS
jgi:hypothetical protein